MAIQLPDHDALSLLDVEVIAHEEPWVSTVHHSNDMESHVHVTWDGFAGSVSIRWLDVGEECFSIEREGLVLLSIDQTGTDLHVACEFEFGQYSSRLSLTHGDDFKLRDTVLQTG